MEAAFRAYPHLRAARFELRKKHDWKGEADTELNAAILHESLLEDETLLLLVMLEEVRHLATHKPDSVKFLEAWLEDVLAELQELYLTRLDYALRTVYALQYREPGDELRSEAMSEAVAVVRELDATHLRRVNEARLEFFDQLRPHDRPVIAEYRAAVSEVLADAAALVIAGGHVGVLAEVLHLFNVAAVLNGTAPNWAAPNGAPVIAWSAGAMTLTDRIVLFHDRAPQGAGHPEVYGSGLSVVRDVVLLPHARARLLLDDTPRMAVFARRFAPARCVPLETGTRIDVSADGTWPPGIRVLGEDGHMNAREAA